MAKSQSNNRMVKTSRNTSAKIRGRKVKEVDPVNAVVRSAIAVRATTNPRNQKRKERGVSKLKAVVENAKSLDPVTPAYYLDMSFEQIIKEMRASSDRFGKLLEVARRNRRNPR